MNPIAARILPKRWPSAFRALTVLHDTNGALTDPADNPLTAAQKVMLDKTNEASLISREVIADSIELVARGHLFDGLVCLVGCDKTIPGAAMALSRLDLPGLVLFNGTIYPGTYKGKNADIVTVFEAVTAATRFTYGVMV